MQFKEFVRLSYWKSLLQINILWSVLGLAGLVAYIFRSVFFVLVIIWFSFTWLNLHWLFFSFFLYKEKIDKNNEQC